MSTTKRAKIVRDFKDAGTERSFSAGETVDLTAGEFANYEAAGLIEVAAATKTADDTKKA
ncbi:hypothetical protein [Sphingobium yanoikuyae]|uniref:hypothetical protein n=1 Tax=Sphingobium yanoikuyae TaxID=13690 RepID=UPI00289743F9|nr:hypothetical protein [Sphingobium yanoikuyae]